MGSKAAAAAAAAAPASFEAASSEISSPETGSSEAASFETAPAAAASAASPASADVSTSLELFWPRVSICACRRKAALSSSRPVKPVKSLDLAADDSPSCLGGDMWTDSLVCTRPMARSTPRLVAASKPSKPHRGVRSKGPTRKTASSSTGWPPASTSRTIASATTASSGARRSRAWSSFDRSRGSCDSVSLSRGGARGRSFGGKSFSAASTFSS
mmetsp:Transcript_39898/g.89416  ORF Transcript_39898/g.89416 Transcript_39898/m.89416 type:complete len:215 (+) Transcript_39898:2285-2929(+)